MAKLTQVVNTLEYFFLPIEFGHGQLPVKISVHSLCISLYPWRVNQ